MFTDDEKRAFRRLRTLLDGPDNLYILHTHADGDAVGSGYALSRVFGGDIVIPDDMSDSGKRVAGFLNTEPISAEDARLEEGTRIFFLDVAEPSRVGRFEDFLESGVIIDHHSRNDELEQDRYFCFPDRTSTSEIVFDLLLYVGKNLGRKVLEALLLGIITDTGHLRYANAKALDRASRILSELDRTMERYMSSLETEIRESQKLAQLRAVRRLRFGISRGVITARTRVSAFESGACEAMLFTGADVALAVSGRGDGYRIIGRAKERVVEKGLDLGNFFQHLGEVLDGSGGGHGGAAGFTGSGDADEALDMAFELLEREIKNIMDEE